MDATSIPSSPSSPLSDSSDSTLPEPPIEPGPIATPYGLATARVPVISGFQATDNQRRLAAKPVLRPLITYDHKGELILTRKVNIEAAMIYMTGQRAENACGYCSEGLGWLAG
ncbi:MAG: hypothetical protein M1824_006577, partial [Vezdaea acicularis]